MQPHGGGYQQYRRQREQEIQTASRVKLVIMLLEGAICFNRKAMAAMEKKERVVALENTDRANKIIMHLYESLNFEQGGRVSEQLASLYNYICDCYSKFAKRDNSAVSVLDSVNTVLNTLLEGWRKIEEEEKNAG